MKNTRPAPPRIGATALGYPRIGRRRELKRALEAYWGGRADVAALDRAGADVRADTWRTCAAAGLTSVPTNTFSLYDQVLDTALMLGVVPARHSDAGGADRIQGLDVTRYFALARGTAEEPPLEMTKWFDTNYHYLVPEIGPETVFTLDPAKVLAEHGEAVAAGLDSRPVLVGPWTFLSSAKVTDSAPESFSPLDRLDDLVPVYTDLLDRLAQAGAGWVQLDEPALVRDLTAEQAAQVRARYAALADQTQRPALLVATYFGNPVEALPALADTGVEAIALDLTSGISPDQVAGLPGLADKTLVLGAVDGHNIWRTDLRRALATLEGWKPVAAQVAVATSCSLLHVPYDTAVEDGLDPILRENLAFADQKLGEVVALQAALDGDAARAEPALAASNAALARRPQIPGLARSQVAARLAGVAPADRERAPRAQRRSAQSARADLPLLPTTTIGSFPQTTHLRKARAAHTRGETSEETYAAQMREEIAAVIALQEELGLDVLVHGEPERNDMVQYFAEQLDGYAATEHGWVQSYGSRCVRPPILYGDVHRPQPMTVQWATYAQSLTSRPVKGMLTGPVTMLAWSFVREDQPRPVTADQVALALGDEVADLEAAGITIVQVDEPALRETLPLRRAEQQEYLRWAVDAFRLATSGVRDQTQIHTHLCYSEFGEIIDAIDGLDADVTSIEAARSRMELLADVSRHGFGGGLGPGVYDIHSPRVPSSDEVVDLLRAALSSLPTDQLWVNPDCGLKTRAYHEVAPALAHMVQAAAAVRAELQGS